MGFGLFYPASGGPGRAQGGRLFAPEARWFVQLGLAQYF